MRALSFGFFLFGLLAASVRASHFRYGTISYRVPDPVNAPAEVELSAILAWRTTGIGSIRLYFGDGGSQFISSGSWTQLGTFSDGAGESYTLVSKTLTRDYGTVGDYEVYFESCCRIGSLVNAANQGFRVEAQIKLGADFNGPQASLPAIVQFNNNAPNSIDINGFISDIDNESYSCLMNPNAGNGDYAPVPTVNGALFSVTSDCKLEWDLTGFVPTNTPKYAISMLIQNAKGVVVPLDFIVEVSSSASLPLTCDPVGPTSFTAQANSLVQTNFEVGGGPVGSTVGDVTLQLAGAQGATLQAQSSPATPLPDNGFLFAFPVPSNASPGSYQFVVQFLVGSQFCSQGVSVLICPDDDNDGVCNAADICPKGDDNVDLDGNGIPDACDMGQSSIKGDPHIAKWNRKSFDFHGECDLLMLHSDHLSGGKEIDLHIRTTIRGFFSSIEVAALRVGEEVLEADSKAFYYNGLEMHDDDLPFEAGEFTLKGPIASPGFKNRREYQVVLNDMSTITILKTKSFLSLSVAGHRQDFEKSYGLLGDFKTGESLGRDGRVINDNVEYGMEWQIQEHEPKLFREAREPQLPKNKCNMPTVSAPSRRRLRVQDPQLFEKAQAACVHAGTEFDACVDDVMNTGDVSYAEAF